jgi:hypothetical protein
MEILQEIVYHAKIISTYLKTSAWLVALNFSLKILD